MRLFSATPQQIRADWAHFGPHLERFARECGESTPEQLLEALDSSHLQAWGLQDHEAVRAVVLTQIDATAWGSVCVIRVAVGGARIPMQERLLDEIGKWARQQGCRSVRFHGRRGWLRRFRRFKEVAVVGEWDLRH